jgi:hypothetical protein
MSSLTRRFLGSKPVVDADDRTIGRIAGAERDPDTRDTVSFLVQLDPEQAPATSARFCWLSLDEVQGIRRDSVQLTERLATILPREVGRTGAHPSARR